VIVHIRGCPNDPEATVSGGVVQSRTDASISPVPPCQREFKGFLKQSLNHQGDVSATLLTGKERVVSD
jgi:hypothetical protein